MTREKSEEDGDDREKEEKKERSKGLTLETCAELTLLVEIQSKGRPAVPLW